jgi:hypothetical protein
MTLWLSKPSKGVVGARLFFFWRHLGFQQGIITPDLGEMEIAEATLGGYFCIRLRCRGMTWPVAMPTMPTLHGMTMSPDELPPSAQPKPKLTAEERRVRTADRLVTIRMRVLIGRALDERGITTPDAIGAALGMPAGEATALLSREQWHEGDVALVEAAAARLALPKP